MPSFDAASFMERDKVQTGASDIKRPGLFRRAINKIQKTDKLIDELNSVCKIEHVESNFNDDNVIAFTPQVSRALSGRGNALKHAATRDYVIDLVQRIGFEDVYFDASMDRTEFPLITVYVSLNNKKNFSRIKQLGGLLHYHYKNTLTNKDIKNVVNNKIVKELNSTCKIEYINGSIAFTPITSKDFDARRNMSLERVARRNQLIGLLEQLGFEKPSVDESMDDTQFPRMTVSVSLKNKKNKAISDKVGNLLRFHYKASLSKISTEQNRKR